MAGFQTWLKKSPDRVYGAVMLCINSLSLGFGVLYLLFGKVHIFWNLYGFLMLAAFLGNVGLAVMEKEGSRLGKTYLALSFLWMMSVPFINTLSSIIPSNVSSQSRLSVMMIFSLFILGGYIGFSRCVNQEDGAAHRYNKRKDKWKLFSGIVAVLLSIVLVSGLYIVFNLLSKDKDGVFEIFVPEYALFYAIAFLSLGMLILKLRGKKEKSIYNYAVIGITSILFMTCILPFAYTTYLLKTAEQSYTAAFGEAWKHNDAFRSSLFRQLPFFMPEYFYGTVSKGFSVREDIVYYEGMDGVDEGLVLTFDVYLPAGEKGSLPGGNSVLIRIHGGGWSIGDNGIGNFAQMNKYFASQGYVVFDIQYGLSDKEKMLKFVPVPITRLGSFTIDDMVRHIGIFTNYLADHRDEYDVNLDSVFISGGSAGGQLTLASGLAMSSGRYNNLFDPSLTLKGLIPFYPANGLTSFLSIDGKEELRNPIPLVTKDSPPCLIYQGTHDGLVPPMIAAGFQDAYLDKGNEKCVILIMPFGSHSSDLYFSGYYNQVFLYYMERFMYQYRE